MPSFYDHAGKLAYASPEILPPDLAKTQSDIIEPLQLAESEAEDNLHRALRNLKRAKELDQAELRDALLKDSKAPAELDRHEKTATAELEIAERVATASHQNAVQALNEHVRAIASHLNVILPAAEARAVQLGDEYKVHLEAALTVRREYGEAVEEWARLVSEVNRPRKPNEIHEWIPDDRGMYGRHRNQIALEDLAALINQDATRHVRPKQRTPSLQDQRHAAEWSAKDKRAPKKPAA